MKASSCHKGKKSAKHFIRKYEQTAKTASSAVLIFAEDMSEKCRLEIILSGTSTARGDG